MDLDPLFISRLQFAFTIIFHIMFPAFTIGPPFGGIIPRHPCFI